LFLDLLIDQEEYKKKLAENLFQDMTAINTPKILAFKKKPLTSPGGLELSTRALLYTDPLSSPPSRIRHIPAV
jgi:hypothetical protein